MPNTQTTKHDKPKGRAGKLAQADELVRDFDKLTASRLLPVEAVALLMNCHVATVWAMAKRGDLPKPIPIGGITRWRAGDLRAALAGAK